jgi:hypothetical protein
MFLFSRVRIRPPVAGCQTVSSSVVIPDGLPLSAIILVGCYLPVSDGWVMVSMRSLAHFRVVRRV